MICRIARQLNITRNMLQLIIGSMSLSIVHASIPNHWIPLIAIGKAENWSTRQTISATVIAGFAHILSTVIVGILIGLAGYELSESHSPVTAYIASTVLVTIGLIYLIIDYVKIHGHHHHLQDQPVSEQKKFKSRITLILSLSIAMFFSPCIELEAYYFQAGTRGWPGIIAVSVIYTILTVFFMSVYVYLGTKGISRLKWHFLERHEKLVTGLILISLGILAFLFRY